MIDNLVLLDVSDTSDITLEWNGLGTATIESVSYTLPLPLTGEDRGTNNFLVPPITVVRVTGAEHGQTYLCEAEVVLSTGETLNRQFTIKGFNS